MTEQNKQSDTPAPETHGTGIEALAELLCETFASADPGDDGKGKAWPYAQEWEKASWRAVAKAALANTPSPKPNVAGWEAITERAIAIICDEAEDMGYTDTTISEFKAGEFDGDDRLTLQAVERAMESVHGLPFRDCTGLADQKLKLWFFRDLSDDQRKKLFGLFGIPVDGANNTHGIQSKALRHVIRALATTEGSDNG